MGPDGSFRNSAEWGSGPVLHQSAADTRGSLKHDAVIPVIKPGSAVQTNGTTSLVPPEKPISLSPTRSIFGYYTDEDHDKKGPFLQRWILH